MEDQLSEVVPREFLVCPLCQEEYQEPKYLPCLHSFCKACIDDHIEATSDHEGCFACPVCATETMLPEAADEPPELPDNTFARRLSCPMTLPGKRDKTCGQCESNEVTEEATIHCINCDEFLCGKCSLNHLEQEETASHKTQKIENYEAENDMPMTTTTQTPALPRCCEYYDALDIGSMYCVDCELSLCAECHANAHKEHRCAELSAISQNFENKIKDPLKELKKDKHTLHKALLSLEGARKYTAKKHQDLKNSVKQRTKVLGTLIQEYENMLIMEIEKRHSQNVAVIQEREDAIQRHIASIKAVTDLTEKLITFGSEEEKVAMRRKIGRRVRELCEEDLPTKHIQLTKCVLSEPQVTVETICEMFGELKSDKTKQASGRKLPSSQSVDLGVISRKHAPRPSISSTEEIPTELTDLEEYEEGEDMDMLSASNTSDAFRPASSMLSGSGASNDDLKLSGMSALSPRHLEVPEASHTDSSFQSSVAHDDVPCHNLDISKKEMHFPDVVARDCIKGAGVNSHGDIIVGTVSPGGGSSKVFILEKHGIVRGQILVEKNWGIHSIAADGKVSLVVPRSDNRYKVKVMSGENNIDVLVDAHIESFGLNSVTATKAGTLLVSANRYATTNPIVGRAAKSGGNITMYDQEGTVLHVITNDTFANIHPYLFDRPHHLAVDHHGNFFVADPGRHSVIGFKADGEFMFEYGNTDAEEELYQGPDSICTDRSGNVIVLDKKDGRIDILNYEGQLQRCYFPPEHVRFVCVTPEKMLMLINSEGEMKFYDYM